MAENIEIKMPEGFEAVSVLGKGAMGTVYKAWQPKLKRNVAIKTTTIKESEEAGQDIGRLEDEALTIAQLNHPNIVSLIDVFRDDEAIYLIMEYLDGPPLSRILNPNNSLEALGPFAELVQDLNGTRVMREEWILEVAHSVGKALSYAHERKVLHRDIKPANIILTESRNVKLLDFSIARNVNQGKGRTVAGTIFGTVQYMSPEQILSADLDGRTDIYSLGCTLYHLATGKVPFVDENEITVCMNHVNTPPVHVSEINHLLTDSTAGMIMKCLDKEPENRYPDSFDYADVTKKMLRALSSGIGFSPISAMDTGEFRRPNSTTDSQIEETEESPSKFQNPKAAVEELNEKLRRQQEEFDSQGDVPGINDLDSLDDRNVSSPPDIEISGNSISSAETVHEEDSTKGKPVLTEPNPATTTKPVQDRNAEYESHKRLKKGKKKRGLEELATQSEELEMRTSKIQMPDKLPKPSSPNSSSRVPRMSSTNYEPRSIVDSLVDAKTAELRRKREKQKKLIQQIIAVVVFLILMFILYFLRFR